eukprot:13680952-Alexandrium_andersonii.AAC.1
MQKASFMKLTVGGVGTAPALTTQSSLMWGKDISRRSRPGAINRPLLPYEAPGVQGFPVLIAAKDPLGKFLPQDWP